MPDKPPLRTRLFTARRKTTLAQQQRSTGIRREREPERGPAREPDRSRVRLCDLASELFAALLSFRATERAEKPAYRKFRQEIGDLLGDFQRRAERAGLDRSSDGRFALVALADETAMGADWEGAPQWKREALQIELFQSAYGGEAFFDRAEQIVKGDDQDLMELYFTCLCAGFVGEKRADAQGLAALRSRLYQRIATLDLRDESHLTPDAYGHHLERPLLIRRFGVLWALPFVLGAVGLYVGYYVTLDRQVDAIPSGAVSAASAPAPADPSDPAEPAAEE